MAYSGRSSRKLSQWAAAATGAVSVGSSDEPYAAVTSNATSTSSTSPHCLVYHEIFLFCESNSGVIHLAIGSCRIHGWFDSALHPSRVAKSTSFGWYKVGKVTAVGWQVTLCDPIWHVISRSGVVILITNCVYFTYFFRSSFRSRWL